MRPLITPIAGILLLSGSALAATDVPSLGTGGDTIREAEGYRALRTVDPAKPLGMRLPLAVRLGLDFIPAPRVVLPELDHVALIVEGEQMLQDGSPMRYGVPRPLDFTEQDGQWIAVPGGRIWQLQITSEGAENVSVWLENLDLPEGAELRTYQPGAPETVDGPFTDDGPSDDGRIYSMIAPVDSVMVEYFEPSAVAGAGLPFEFDILVHGYLPVLKDGLAGGSGACHNNATCDPSWADVGDATAVMFYGGGFVCSGQLIATTAQDEQPYFLTANHCISSQGQASSAQFIFRYERNNCTGSFNNGASTSGSTLVDTHAASDNTLLRINGSLPANTFWVGWTTDTATTNLDVVCLHHPGGDYMKISYGDINSNPVCGSSTYWFGVRWNDGVTEGGSSGSGAYRASDQKLMGVLTCGASSCSNPTGLDGYGRFVRAYNAGFSDYLVNGTPDDDPYEENDTCSSAAYLNTTFSLPDLVVKSKDEDWYRLNLDPGMTVNVNLDFAHANGDIDIRLYSASCSGALEDEGVSNTNDESVSYSNFGETIKRVYLHVYLDSGSENTYDMDITFEENPDPLGACCTTFCSEVTLSDCDAVGGTWGGANTTCEADTCVDPNGACCINNACYQLTEELCLSAGGSFGGDDSPCDADTCAPECPADVNGDGVVDGEDLAATLGNWGQSTGDLTGDGVVDGQDLSVILGFWGPC